MLINGLYDLALHPLVTRDLFGPLVKILPTKKVELNNLSVQNSDAGLDEYNSLKLMLFAITIGLSGIIFSIAWAAWSLSTALNYLLGACVGVVYLRMLARGIDRLGKQGSRLGYSRFVLFIVLIVVAARAEPLHILPAFLGFMTYKAAILVYAIRDLVPVSPTWVAPAWLSIDKSNKP